MKTVSKLTMISALLLVFNILIVPAAAQEGQGEGGIIIVSDFGDPPATFRQIYCTDTSCQDRIIDNMYIDLIGINPDTMVPEPHRPRALAESWEVSEDGTVYT